MKVVNQTKVALQEIGLYIKVIKLDFNPKNNKELAKLISDTFNLNCTELDIENYERLHIHHRQIEDFELESRKQQYGVICG